MDFPVKYRFLHWLLAFLFSGLAPGYVYAAEPATEVVSFRCALAIDAALTELDEQVNPIIREVLSTIDDVNGQLVCIQMSSKEIQVRLQSTDMTSADNRLVFSIDAKTYTVLKTFYGR